MIAIDWSKQQALDADSKAIQQIDFAANLQCQSYILELYNVLVQIWLTTSKTKRDI